MSLTERVEAWRRAGSMEEFRDRSLHVHVRPGEGPLILLLHGFPSSSYDWRDLLALEPQRAALAFDFLGFGLSDKPRDHSYTLSWQADLAEELVARHGEGRPVFICAHDMGTSVATELLARDVEGRLPFRLSAVLLLNGSMVLERASLSVSQRALRSRLGPLVAALSNEPAFGRSFARLFSPSHPLTPEEAADQWALLAYGGGNRILHKLIHYLRERVEFAERWHGALRNWEGELELAWAMLDPIATPAVLDAVVELRPNAPVTRFADLGHYLQIEAPEAIAPIVARLSGA
jgi:pimeloyl-ACP methyl ester carboxylesterase